MAIQVLSIGNSFSQDAQRYLHDLARSEKADIETVNLMIGGCSLERHFRNFKGERKDYTLGANGHNIDGFRTSIQEALLARKWNVITLQQSSPESYKEETYEPYLQVLSDAVRDYCPQAKLYIHQTWGYESGSERIRQHGFETYEEMFVRVQSCYDKAAKRIDADGIIPSGAAFACALQMGIGKIHRDTFHASLGTGRFLLALVWYCYITQNSIQNMTFSDFDECVNEQEYAITLKAAEVAVSAG